MHYGTCTAYHGYISPNVQLQKLSIGASESVCCNASPQRAQARPRQTWDPPGVRPGNAPGHFVMYTVTEETMRSFKWPWGGPRHGGETELP